MKNTIQLIKSQFPSGLVVFLVALPLCLGIGLAATTVTIHLQGGEIEISNVFSGIISGIIGGIVVGSLSGSRIGVSGPAAGLITIVSAAIVTLGSFEAFLVAVLLAGIVQLVAGFLKAGIIGAYFPSSVIKGMLAAIGITLILKEIPHLIGYDKDYMGDLSFSQSDGQNTFSELIYSLRFLNFGAVIVSFCGLAILILYDTLKLQRFTFFRYVPGALIVVLLGIGMNELFQSYFPALAINSRHLVSLPVTRTIGDIPSLFTHPDFSALANPQVYGIALTIALVASLETLLSVEATDKLSGSLHRTPANRELKAQGIGNIVAGLAGGLPITQVIVRSTANVSAGGSHKSSAIIHGIILFVSVLTIPLILNKIPYAALAAILMIIGYKLARVALFVKMYRLGWEQFLPFAGTIVAVLMTDLLRGIAIGSAISIFFILKHNFQNNFRVVKSGANELKIVLSEEVSFLNKGGLQSKLESIPDHTRVVIDGSNCDDIDYDVLELISNFVHKQAVQKHIEVQTINIPQIA